MKRPIILMLCLILMLHCSDKNEYFYTPIQEPQSEAITYPNTKIILKEDVGKNLIAIDSTTIIFKRGSQAIENLKANDIIVSDSGSGLLKKITKIEYLPEQLKLELEQAALTDALEKCKIDYKKAATEDMIKNIWLADGVSMPALKKSLRMPEKIEFTFKFAEIRFPGKDANPYIELSGQVSFTADFEFYLDIDESGLKEFKWGIKGAISPQIEYSANGEIPGIKRKFLLSRIQFNPIIILVPTPLGVPFPIVITPESRFYIGLNAELSVGISSSISFETGLSGGIHYVDSEPRPYLEPVFEPSFEWAEPSGGFAIKIYPENQSDLFLYGVAGPSIDLKPFAEFDYDLFRKPSAKLNVGFEGGGGIYLRIFDKTLIDYSDSSFWKLKWHIWSSPAIANIEPENVKAGDELTISGNAFGPGGVFQGKNYVLFNNVKALDSKRWENEKIIAQVPENAESGKLSVFVPIYIPAVTPVIPLPILINTDVLIQSNQVDYFITGTNPNGIIKGRVTDASSGNPISGASIATQPATNSVTSDASGKYEIENVSPGNYIVSASKTGYHNGSVTITIQPGSTIMANIQLIKTGSIPAEGLVAHYPFNGNAKDESGNANHGAVSGAALSSDRFGNSNKAFSFDGINDLINCGHQSSLQLSNAITISAWFNSTSSSVLGRYIIGKCDNNSPSYEYMICFDYSAGVSGYGLKSCIGGLNFDESGTNFKPDANKWYHVAVTWEYPGTFKLYLNGMLLNTKPTTSLIEHTDQDMIIGCIRPSGEPQMRYFSGKIDDIRIYNRALTDSEILQLYCEGE
ncbi:carboxypeptidase regulatory-like domain-containing protein [candidate division KSB1 bacterium]|nr:carboxypeptidase regulatory-like domain-containing protein [candidate division KSB1 bacterium]